DYYCQSYGSSLSVVLF
nr:immunoglobulin light chain junction region [Macaca mulatta]